MSLHVYLTGDKYTEPCRCQCCGNEHTRETSEEYFCANITHNLGRMANAAGIYDYLWRPEAIGVAKARQLIEPLKAGLKLIKENPAKFEALNPPNGWGDYDGFLPWIERYVRACEDYPDANVYASR